MRKFGERVAMNSPIQGSAADIIKIAMLNVSKKLSEARIDARIILQVHDELNFSVYPEEKEKVQQIVIEEMEKAYTMQVPLRADCGWGKHIKIILPNIVTIADSRADKFTTIYPPYYL